MTDDITIRHAEPDDYEALNRIIAGPRAIWGTLVLPWTPVESSRKLVMSMDEGRYWLVACVKGEIVGSIGLHMHTLPRRRHAASLGMGWFVIPWDMGGVPKFLIITVVSFALIMALYELLIRRVDGVRFFFGMRPKQQAKTRPALHMKETGA